jgi:E3 ubiquitin-protein ligase DOA10
MAEKIFYQSSNALVTNARVVLKGITYPTANITSVKCVRLVPSNFYFILFLLLFLMIGLGSGLLFLKTRVIFFLCSFVVSFALNLYLILEILKNKNTYYLCLGTAGMDKHALKTKTLEEIEPIKNAINDAIVSRS